VAIVPLLVLLLTWPVAARPSIQKRKLFDIALGDLDRFAMLESALYRDVFTARARHIAQTTIHWVREINALHDSLARLRETAAIDGETTAAPRSTRGVHRPAG